MAGGFRSPLFFLGIGNPTTPVVVTDPPPTPQVLLDLPTPFKAAGITVIYSDFLGRTSRSPFLGSFSEQLDSYSHEIRATGGLWSSSFSLKANEGQIKDWLSYGVGRHIEVFDQAQGMIWEGFVDKVTVNLENIQVSVGPLISSEMANRVKVRYSIADYTLNPPLTGITLTTANRNNTDSQQKYGIIDKVLNLNEATNDLALQVRNSWARENSTPKVTYTSSYASFSEPSLTIDCLGYWHYLNTWIYNNGTTGAISVTDKILEVIETDPNNLFDVSISDIDTNTTVVKREESGDRTALSVLSELVPYGNADNDKFVMGVYQGRVFKYKEAPTTIRYFQEAGGLIKLYNGADIYPWNITPGEWIYYSGIMVDSYQPSSLDELYQDPASAFIESTSFQSPNNLSLTTLRLSKLDLVLAKLGVTSL